MTTYRISAEFDLEVIDEEAARKMASAVLQGITEATLAEGGTIDAVGDTPEAAIAKMVQNDRVVVSAVAKEIIGRGVTGLPWLAASDLTIKNEPKA